MKALGWRARLGFAATVVAFVGSVAHAPVATASSDDIGAPRERAIGTFGGIAYVQYDGVFEGATSTGAFRVPYRITAPDDPTQGNGTVLVEPAHFNVGLGALNSYLGRNFLLPRGFVHAGIGWSEIDNRMLDRSVPGTFVDGGSEQYGGSTDDEIIVDFARALASDPDAAAMVGAVARRYATGFSDSSGPLLRLVSSGRAKGVFDFMLPFIPLKDDPQRALAADRYDGKLTVVLSEYDKSKGFVDTGAAPSQYRSYVVPGTPHVPDHFTSTTAPPTSPASHSPELRARFLQGHAWVTVGTTPPLSTRLRTAHGNAVSRDAVGNALAEDSTGQLVPRLPFVELGEARFETGFRGSYDSVRSIQELGFASHAAYVAAFDSRLADQLTGGFILTEDANVMRARAGLCPPLTLTETYRDHYANFVSVVPC